MHATGTVSPELASGLRDYLPEDMIPRQQMFDAIRAVFERFGFSPIDTPGLEKEAVLTGGDPNFGMQIFRARLRGADEGLALRFDLTVPLARFVSLHFEKIERPFKRYHMGKVWRGEKPQAGRYREFVQFDSDIVGTDRISADAEIVSLIYETMTALGLSRFIIRVNNRKILNGLAGFAGYDAALGPDILRTIDKLDKIGWQGVSKELSEKGLTGAQIDVLGQFVSLPNDTVDATLDSLASLMSASAEALEGIQELREMAKCIRELGVPPESWKVDLSVARGLGYYTGPVFETILTDLPSIGSVFSGGRYDGLVARFGSQSLPATGASVGVDRLFAAMETLGLVRREKTVSQAIILNFDPSAEGYCQRIAADLRKAQIRTELYLGTEKNLKGQLAYALRQSAPVIIVAGGNEMAKDVVQVKDMRNRKQIEVLQVRVVESVRGILTL